MYADCQCRPKEENTKHGQRQIANVYKKLWKKKISRHLIKTTEKEFGAVGYNDSLKNHMGYRINQLLKSQLFVVLSGSYLKMPERQNVWQKKLIMKKITSEYE